MDWRWKAEMLPSRAISRFLLEQLGVETGILRWS